MHVPADRTAKRISTQEWFARYDAVDLMKPVRSETPGRAPREMPAPADRIAVRA